MVLPEEEVNQLEEGSFEHRGVMLEDQVKRSSQTKRMTPEEEGPIQGVEVKEEVEILPIDATNVTSWAIDLLSFLTMRRDVK